MVEGGLLHFGSHAVNSFTMDPSSTATPNGFGEALRSARESRGVTLETIGDRTKISRSVLLALEAGDFAKLPDRVFVRMFLRQVLSILDEDERPWLQAFEGAWGRFVRASQPLVVVAPPSPVRRTRPGPWILGGVIAVASVVLLVHLGTRSARSGRPGEPGTTATVPSAPASRGGAPGMVPLPSQTPAAVEAPPTPQPSGPAAGSLLVISTTGGSCWASVTVAGRAPLEKLLPPGFRWEVETGGKPVDLVLGDAGVAQVDYDGVHRGPVGARGQVVRLHLAPAEAGDGAQP